MALQFLPNTKIKKKKNNLITITQLIIKFNHLYHFQNRIYENPLLPLNFPMFLVQIQLNLDRKSDFNQKQNY